MRTDRTLTLSILVAALVACSQGSATGPASPTAAALATSAPAASSRSTSAVPPTGTPPLTSAPSLAPAPMASATVSAATKAPAAPGVLPGGDLSEAEMAVIFQVSFASYPWRMKETTTAKSSRQMVTALVEAQSSTRVHIVTQQSIVSSSIIIESILITPTLYMKATGAPPEIMQQVGAKEGQWRQVPNSSPLVAFAQMAYLAANPSQLLGSIGLQDLLKPLNPNQKSYKLVRTESAGNVLTKIYEYTLGAGDSAVTYRVSIGASDGRIYKMVSDGPQHLTSTTVEYDPSINIQPPL